MDKSKRDLIKGLSVIGTGVFFQNKLFADHYIEDNGNLIYFKDEIEKSKIITDIQKKDSKIKKIIPSSLRKGSKIAFTAPASPTNMWEISSSVNFYKKNGCEVVIGDTIRLQKNQYRYFSAPDEIRAAEFMKFIEDKTISGIICGRGGYGTGRILKYLDFELIKNNPKIIIGFSDISILLLAITKMTGLVTFHGPVASVKLNTFTGNNLLNSIFYKENYTNFKIPGIQIINEGAAEGEIVGGNLTMLISTMGTPYEIDTNEKLLFIEDVAEHAYEVDRMLTQLYNANKLQVANAIIFNGFKNINSRRPFYPNKGYSIKEVIDQIVKPLNKPLIYNFEFGHEDNMITLPIGIKSKIDTKSRTFEFLEKPVI